MSRTISLSLGELDKPVHIVLWQESVSRESISDTLNTLLTRIASLEDLVHKQTHAFFPLALAPTPAGLDVTRAEPAAHHVATAPAAAHHVASASAHHVATPVEHVASDAMDAVEVTELDEEELEADEEMEVEEEVEEEEEEAAEEEVEVEEEAEEVEEEEAEEAVEEEAEEEEEVQELESIEWKGVTYYKDAQNQVYKLDSDGDLDDTPYGVWNEEKKKVIRYS
jgi:hypothetical protein